MSRGSRARSAAVLSIVLYTFGCITSTSSIDYGIPIEIKLWDTGRTPLAHMVDATNGFALKVLAEHNFLNENNIAFSPYGLMGILVALYEGVDGESSFQIQRALQLPWNRNVMRVGFRDIHRTLKTYFVPEEGFLAGLALNNENVTFNESYRKVLRFYGFDLESDQLPTLPPQTNNGTDETAATTTTQNTPTQTTIMPMTTTEAMSGREDPSTIITTEAITSTGADIINDEITTTTSSSLELTSEITTQISTQSSMEPITMTEQVTEIEVTSTTTVIPTTLEETTTSPTSTVAATTSSADDKTTVNNDVEIISTVNTDSTTDFTSTMATNSEMISTDTDSSESTTASMSTVTSTDAEMVTLAEMITAVNNESTLETLERRKKSIVDFLNPPYVDDYLIYRSYEIPIPDYSGVGDGGFRGQGNMFLVNGLRNIQVSYMFYDTVLDHAYLPHLEASALRLPLDSERYYLLVVLPSSRSVVDLGRLLARMARESDLSDVHTALRPRRVNAIVPSFTVKGHVTLTTDLQKLGVRDVFEPRQRDFTPMTGQAGVYVRSIEQAVSVAIRKYKNEDQKSHNRYVNNRQPVKFSATYPFLYFVMDSSIHVALMAGKMVDPLNNRIL